MRVTLIPFDGVSELGRTAIDGVTVAAHGQVVLDAYGGVDRMAEQADILLGLRGAQRTTELQRLHLLRIVRILEV
ncbi:hypothetical protein [Georgenia yuyongxinii]